MNPFLPVKRDVRENQIYREALLAQPAEFFLSLYGVLPSAIEKLYMVEKIIQTVGAPRVFANDVYLVRVRNMPPFVQLHITRHDGQPCGSWQDFQSIKNELVGAECEAVELFPAESRLVDTSNEYHLWVNPDRNHRFPFGFPRRLVLERPIVYGKGDDGVPLAADNAALACPLNAVS